MSNTDDQRAAFEAWASRHTSTMHVELDQAGIYIHHVTHMAWLAWQEAIEQAKKTMCNRS